MTKEARSTNGRTITIFQVRVPWPPLGVAMLPDMPTQSGGHATQSIPLAVLLLIFMPFLALALPNARAEEPSPAASSAQSPLTGMVELRYLRCRSGAPIPIVWNMEWNGQTIVEGNLDFEVEDGNQLLGHFRVSDIVLAPGKNVFNAMLPPLSVFKSSVPITIRARFVSRTGTLELAEQSLRVPSRFVQWFNVGVVSGATAHPSREESRLLESISLERHLPPTDVLDRSTTVALEFQTSALPNDPLTLCNFDVVVLLPAALAELRDDQAAALRKWVIAGGSLCVVPGGGLTPRHAALIDDLLAESAGHEAFVVDGRGYLAPGEGVAGEIISARKGLGRIVMLRQALLQTLKPDAKEWLAAADFLMKVRREEVKRPIELPNLNWPFNTRSPATFVRPGRPSAGPAPQANSSGGTRPRNPSGSPSKSTVASPQPRLQTPQSTLQVVPGGNPSNPNGQWSVVAARRLYDPTAQMRSELSPPAFATMDGLLQILMPRDVQVVPLGMIAAILAAYVVMIGPVDYFFLGFLRLRRFTWILFPVVTIAFAGFTLWLSRWYLGTNDSTRAIEVYDLVQGGAVARQTRIELLFLSQQREVGTEVQNGVFSQIGLGTLPDPRRPGSQIASEAGRIDESIVGRFPSRYIVGQAIPQWTPVANRLFWIDPQPAKIAALRESDEAGTDPKASFNWDDPGDITTDIGRAALGARIERAFGKTASAVVYRARGRSFDLLNSFESLRSWQPHRERYVPIAGLEEIVRELSAPSPEKLFFLASQISPNGSPGLEDLALLDRSDPRQSLLVIAVENGSKLTLYRRLYVGDP
jgi:hypothetical protein